MFSFRTNSLCIVGFALLAPACADDMQVQRPMHVDAIDQGSENEDNEKESTAVDAGGETETDTGSRQEADAGSDREADAGSEPEADAATAEADAGEPENGKGLPCDVEKLLKMRCQGCHSAQAKNGVALMTFEDLMAPAKAEPNVPVFERVLARIESSERPMPPMGKGMPVTEAELAMLRAWIDDGTPGDRCAP